MLIHIMLMTYYNMMFEIITLQNFQNWKQLLTIPNGLDGWPATRPSASYQKLNTNQNHVFQRIKKFVEDKTNDGKLIFLDAPGGTGKHLLSTFS